MTTKVSAPPDPRQPLALAALPVQVMVDPRTGLPFYMDESTGTRLPAQGVAASPLSAQ